eukprot:8433803-Pyramimonas_sp.AAC.1
MGPEARRKRLVRKHYLFFRGSRAHLFQPKLSRPRENLTWCENTRVVKTHNVSPRRSGPLPQDWLRIPSRSC